MRKADFSTGNGLPSAVLQGNGLPSAVVTRHPLGLGKSVQSRTGLGGCKSHVQVQTPQGRSLAVRVAVGRRYTCVLKEAPLNKGPLGFPHIWHLQPALSESHNNLQALCDCCLAVSTSMLVPPSEAALLALLLQKGVAVAQQRLFRSLENYQCRTEEQKFHQNLAPVLVVISGNSLVFLRDLLLHFCCSPEQTPSAFSSTFRLAPPTP